MAINASFLTSNATRPFTCMADIDSFFNGISAGSNFISWFNANRDNTLWDGRSISASTTTSDAITRLWSNDYIQILFAGGITVNLFQFLALQCVIIQETGGSLTPIREQINLLTSPHPGIAYLFDAIPGLKVSYNHTTMGNKDCLTLFNDTNYNAAFSAQPLGNILQNTTDASWSGTDYSATGCSPSDDPTITGYILQADFYKFRGLGLIMTTWRPEYIKLINFVLSYTGTNAIVNNAKTNWRNYSPALDTDIIATMSAYTEWDDLFMNSDLLAAVNAIQIHNNGHGNYLGNLSWSDVPSAESSIITMGTRINGSASYANTLLSRIGQLTDAIQAASTAAGS